MPFNYQNFIRGCIQAERSVDDEVTVAPYFIAADFLIARSIIETGMTEGADHTSGNSFGPFLLSVAEWDVFITSVLNNPIGSPQRYDAGRTDLIRAQCLAAGWREHLDIAAIGAAMTADGAVDYACDYMELFLTYLVGAPSTVALKKAANQAAALSATLSAAQIAALKSRAAFATLDATTTIAAFLALADTTLADALVKAFAAIKTHAPDEIQTGYAGAAPWFEVATAELNAGVSEATNIARVKHYFTATNHGPPSKQTPWCGAFVAFCLKEAGYGGLIPPGAAASASWANWGDMAIPVGSSDIPKGAIVVLSPTPDTHKIGHVGFYSGPDDAGRLVILGGNQSNKVRELAFSRSQVRGIRWLKALPPKP